jgi:hypothetical protein
VAGQVSVDALGRQIEELSHKIDAMQQPPARYPQLTRRQH